MGAFRGRVLALGLALLFFACSRRQLDPSWGIPKDFSTYGGQLKEVDVPEAVTDLRWIPRGVDRLSAGGSQITNLAGLPAGLVSLDISDTAVHQLVGLPEGLKELDISGTAISELDGLPAGLEILKIGSTRLGASKPTKLPRLPSGLIALDVLAPFTRPIEIRELPLTLQALSLHDLGIYSLDWVPPSLQMLTLEGTAIKKLPRLPQSLGRLILNGNQALTMPELPEYLGSLVIHGGVAVGKPLDPGSHSYLTDLEVGIRDFGLPLIDKLLMLHYESRSVTLDVRGKVQGRIYMRQGQIVHAKAAGEVGEAALQRLLSVPIGSIDETPELAGDTPSTIRRDTLVVLFDLLGQIDDKLTATPPLRQLSLTISPDDGKPVAALMAVLQTKRRLMLSLDRLDIPNLSDFDGLAELKWPKVPSLSLNACAPTSFVNMDEDVSALSLQSCSPALLQEWFSALPALSTTLRRLRVDFLDPDLSKENLPALPPKLVYLELHALRVESLPQVPPTLEFLDLSRSKLLRRLPSLLACQKLTEVNISHTAFDKLPPLPPSVKRLDISGTAIRWPVRWPEKLEELTISPGQFRKLGPVPKTLKALRFRSDDGK